MFQCQLALYGGSGTWAPCTTGVSYGPEPDGYWQFQVEAVDGSGDTSDPPAQWLVNVDNAGPVMAFLVSPPKYTRSTGAGFQFQPNEAVQGEVTCQLDGGASSDCSSGLFSVTGLAEATHTLKIKAHDVLGNSGSTNFKWTVDETAPALSLTGPATYTNQTTATFTVTGSERLDKTMGPTCALDGVDQLSVQRLISSCRTGKAPFTNLADGPHTFQAAGAAGAINPPGSVCRAPCVPCRWVLRGLRGVPLSLKDG